MKNKDIREAIVRSGLRYWQIAAALSIQDGTFSRKLRAELSADEKARIYRIIDVLKSEAS